MDGSILPVATLIGELQICQPERSPKYKKNKNKESSPHSRSTLQRLLQRQRLSIPLILKRRIVACIKVIRINW